MAPSASSGPSSFFRRPGLALVFGLAAVVACAIIEFAVPPPVGPVWSAALIALVALAVPAAVAVGLSARFAAGPGYLSRVLFGVRWIDLLWGVSVGLLLRAVVELSTPTRGALGDGFVTLSPLDIAVVVLVSAIVAPILEEALFRGVLVGALSDAVRSWDRAVAAGLAITVSTVLFVALHAIARGGWSTEALLGPFLVSVGAGILFLTTRRLAAPIVAHVVFNAIGLGLLLL